MACHRRYWHCWMNNMTKRCDIDSWLEQEQDASFLACTTQWWIEYRVATKIYRIGQILIHVYHRACKGAGHAFFLFFLWVEYLVSILTDQASSQHLINWQILELINTNLIPNKDNKDKSYLVSSKKIYISSTQQFSSNKQSLAQRQHQLESTTITSAHWIYNNHINYYYNYKSQWNPTLLNQPFS